MVLHTAVLGGAHVLGVILSAVLTCPESKTLPSACHTFTSASAIETTDFCVWYWGTQRTVPVLENSLPTFLQLKK